MTVTQRDVQQLRNEIASLKDDVTAMQRVMDILGFGPSERETAPELAFTEYNPAVLIPAASMFVIGPVSIPNDVQTDITGYLAEQHSRHTFTQGRGFSLDVDNGLIEFEKLEADLGWISYWGWIAWESNSSGNRRIIWTASDGSQATRHLDASIGHDQEIEHRRVVDDDQSWARLACWQNSGGSLDINYALFTALKLG